MIAPYINGIPISRGPRGLAGPDGNPIGTVLSFMGTTPPNDYLACDGTIHNIADYPDLAAFFAAQYGSSNHFGGDGETTFGVPNIWSSVFEEYQWWSPQMTSNTTPSPYVASASSTAIIFGKVKSPFYAFDNNSSSIFESDGSTNPTDPWLAFDFGKGVAMSGISLTAANTNANSWNKRLPKAFTLKGSNDGTTWTSIYTADGTLYSEPEPGDTQEYRFSPVTYRYYRIISHTDYTNNASGNYFITANVKFLCKNEIAMNLYCIKAVESSPTSIGAPVTGSTTSSEVYSTEETVIGRWIDNRPLYRRVLQNLTITQTGAWEQLFVPTENISVHRIDAYIWSVAKDLLAPLSDVGGNDPVFFVKVIYNHSAELISGVPNGLCGYTSSSVYLNRPIDVVLEYTKSTDEPLPDISDGSGAVASTANLQFGHGLTTAKTGTTTTVSVNTVNDFDGDKTLPISAVGVETQIGNIESLMETI